LLRVVLPKLVSSVVDGVTSPSAIVFPLPTTFISLSSSVIVAVTCCVPFSVPLVTLEISTTTVSFPSLKASSTPVILAVFDKEPALTVIEAAAE
jgi:hypothetical protein